ncbi:MAG: hypothetical protein JJU11_14865, partial [Candidatus Sumerlaeia bacterium]|nr:hypothetical protein [Candidatus Sumerlaeia bacterium]
MDARDSKGTAVAEDRLAPVLERLKPDSRIFAGLENEANLLLSTWVKAVETARSAEIDKVKDQYQSQLSKIVSTTATRGVSKHHFKGPNPAKEEEEIEKMLDFAVENEFEVEIKYVKSNRSEVSEVVAPEGVERDRLLGRCRSRDNAFAVYKIDRILEARLL